MMTGINNKVKVPIIISMVIMTASILANTVLMAVVLDYYMNMEKDLMKYVYVKHEKQVLLTPAFMYKTPKEGLEEALKYYKVKHSKIVYAQAVLETGNFTSKACLKYNNLFGLFNSKTKRYYKFDHWSESVVFYVNYIQYRYGDRYYYDFLKNIGYAEDPEYIAKLKEIKNNTSANN